VRVAYEDLLHTILRIAAATGLSADRAALCARLFADATLDGVASHGLNRFPRFIQMIRSGLIDVHAQPKLVAARGALERWDGGCGPGNLNAFDSMARAIALSREHGLGCVALANTNHWMRGGSYGWQAADDGVIGICWTNTLPNLPPWGSSEPRLGNNPLVIAVPRTGGHVVLDMAMSQFSVGALAGYEARGERLPVEGGYDARGELTRDASQILKSNRLLPIGYWKGSGLALVLDLLAATLAGGRATHQIPSDPLQETGLSQIFLALDPSAFGDASAGAQLVDAVIDNLHGSPALDNARVTYPGERTLETRRRNLVEGVPVDPEIWAVVQRL
jgi:3-dehydro-L-gulonate 2-dehydrogenase